MNRLNIFRGKSVHTGNWVFGSLIVLPSGKHYITWGESYVDNIFEVRPETVGQLTGLTEKKKNAIFEDDIVRLWIETNRPEDGDGHFITGVVEYSPAEFYIRGDGYSITCHFHYNGADREVIGNIFDNPELKPKQ